MKFFLKLICLLCVSRTVIGKEIYQENYEWIYEEEVSYNDLINLNASCYPKDSCWEERDNDPPDIAYGYSCSCHPQCWQFDTCCIDSPYRNYSTPNQECRSVTYNDKRGYYMVHKCPGDMNENSVWKSLCESEWNGEDDILMLSPVTSLETNTTYKNFYCFKCHEATNNFISWNLDLQSKKEVSEERAGYYDGYTYYNGNYNSYDKDNKTYTVTYDQENKTWMATMVGRAISIPVNLSFEFPTNTQFLPVWCDIQVITDCPSTWTDRDVHKKCRAYTAIVHPPILYRSYKNVHCALCNNETLDNISCVKTVFAGFAGDTFSFKHLLNINEPGEDKVGQEGKCKQNELWDPYGKKCRELKCAIPRYVIKDGRCTPP